MIHGIQTLLAANIIHFERLDLLELEATPLLQARWKPGDWVSYATYPDSLGIIVSPEIISSKWVKILWCGETGKFQLSPQRLPKTSISLEL